MIAAVIGWVKTIILVVLFASFLELLLPASSMQRFVRVIMGLLVMLAMLTPVIDLIQNQGQDQLVAAWRGGTGGSNSAGRLSESTGKMVRDRDQLTIEIYKRDLSRQVRALVIAAEGVGDAKVAVEVSQVNGRVGAIEKITIYVKPQPAGIGTKTAPVRIGDSAQQDGDVAPALRAKLVKTVRELYQLKETQVDVKRMD